MSTKFAVMLALLCLRLLSIRTTKMFKTHYQITLERLEIVYLDKSKINGTGGLHFYNRTTKSLYAQARLLADIKDDAYVSVKEYVMRNNEYKLTAIQFEYKLRDALQVDYAGLQKLYNAVVPPLVWPVRKGVTYRLDNWVHDDAKIPLPYAPEGYWKMVITGYLTRNSAKVIEACCYDHVIEVAEF